MQVFVYNAKHETRRVFIPTHDTLRSPHDGIQLLYAKHTDEGGHYLEFGVYEGKSINYLANLNKKITFHGFDSFKGLPEKWFMGHKVVEEGHFAIDGLPKVVPNVVLHEGLFDKTIPIWKKDHKRHISFINIDCDLYKSTQTVLELLNDQIVSGTLLRFDDLLASPISPYPNWEQGEWKALVEWCQKYNRKVTPLARSWKQGCTMKVEV